MTARENALRILRFNQPERVIGGMPGWGVAYLGCNLEGYDGVGDGPVGARWTDIWGVGWHKEHGGVMGFPRVHPLADPAALRGYQWPDPDDERICGQIYRQAQAFPGGDCFLSGSHRSTLWERAYKLVGMETMMMAFYEEPAFAREVLHRIMDFQLGIAKHYLNVGIEIAGLGDDLGTQIGPLLSPQIVEEFLVPEYTRLFELYKANGVIIGFHSCGQVEWMLDTFLRLGVDVLNPVQASANDLDAMRARTQGRMALEGGVSSAVLLDGPPERIAAEVQTRLRQLGRQGGYFCAPDQGMPWPSAHYEAYRQALEEYGAYPLA